MKIVVYGMGIIGASLAVSLKKAGHKVYGKNRSKEPLSYALEHGMIDAETEDFDGADVVFLALPPAVTVCALEETFPNGCIVSDICGVKLPIERAVYRKARNFRYVGAHPMAGKETSGIRSASDTLFQDKNLILTVCDKTDESALKTLKALGSQAGFSRTVICSAEEHDRKIALTSQLAHIVSNAYIRSPAAEAVTGFTGGSFQDMTRVGGVDEWLWTELYFANREFLLAETDGLIARLSEYRDALQAQDEEKMRSLLREGKRVHKLYYTEK